MLFGKENAFDTPKPERLLRRVIHIATNPGDLQALADEVGSERSLLVCCAAFHGVTATKAAERWPNRTLKKIPKVVLARCEWGHDYSLNVANLPLAAPEPQAPSSLSSPASGRRSKTKAAPTRPDLFGDGGENAP